jgi:hypothetical protein
MRADRPEVDLLLFDESVSVFYAFHAVHNSFLSADVPD